MKFLNYISEAPIRIDLGVLRSRLLKVFNKQGENKDKLLDNLNNEFSLDNIEFVVTNKPADKDLINGTTFTDTVEILIEIGIKVLSLSKKEIMKRVIEVMEHELVHRAQLNKSDGKAFKPMDKVDARNVDQYLADKAELMSFAIQAVTTLRHEGFKDSQIIDMLRNPEKWVYRIGKSRSHLDIYADIFKKDSYQVKRLKKQMIQYIGE